MRVLVVTDTIGTRSSAQAGAVIARAWADAVPGVQVAVVPVGEAGGGFLTALAAVEGVDIAVAGEGSTLSLSVRGPDTLGVGLEPDRSRSAVSSQESSGLPDLTASSYALGSAVRTALTARPTAASPPEPTGVIDPAGVTEPTGVTEPEPPRAGPRTLVVDLGGLESHDGGAGLLAGLGATADVELTGGVAGLAELSELDLDPVRRLLAGVRLVGVLPHDEQDRVLLGLRGITSRLRTPGADPAELLAVDARLATLARLARTGPDGTDLAGRPGAGAAGGAGFAILALGGELVTGTGYLAERQGLDQTLARCDLVVTGCTVFDFASRGGGVVAQLARRAEQALRPCIAIAGEVLIGGREMRTMGIEGAYPVIEAHQLGGQSVEAALSGGRLSETAARVARGWAW